MGDPSSSPPPKGGEPLEGRRKQKDSPPPSGGEPLSLQKGKNLEEEKRKKGEKAVVSTATSKAKPSPKKPVVTSNVMIVDPTQMSKTQAKKVQRIEKEMSQLQEQLREKTQTLRDMRGGKQVSSIPNESRAQMRAQQPMKTAGKKKDKAPTSSSTSTPKEAVQTGAGKHAPVSSETLVASGETYAMVVRKRRSKGAKPAAPVSGGTASAGNNPKTQAAPLEKKIKRRKPPKTAAVIVTCKNGGYKDLMQEIRAKIKLIDLGIDDTRIRSAMNGGQMIEVAGTEKDAKADRLASKLREVIRQEGVKICRPTMRAELRIRDIDVSVTADEIRDALAAKGQCSPDAIRMGPIRRAFNGMGIMWFQCPLASANRMTETRRIRIGWTALRVERLPARPLQCFKCLKGGHVQDRCPNNVDHRGRCHRCGEPGHISSACTREVHCIACAENNFPVKHRHGKAACQSLWLSADYSQTSGDRAGGFAAYMPRWLARWLSMVPQSGLRIWPLPAVCAISLGKCSGGWQYERREATESLATRRRRSYPGCPRSISRPECTNKCTGGFARFEKRGCR